MRVETAYNISKLKPEMRVRAGTVIELTDRVSHLEARIGK